MLIIWMETSHFPLIDYNSVLGWSREAFNFLLMLCMITLGEDAPGKLFFFRCQNKPIGPC